MTRREAFDSLVLDVVHDLDERWHAELGLVEFAVEETPLVPDDWAADTVPLATLVRGTPVGECGPGSTAGPRIPRSRRSRRRLARRPAGSPEEVTPRA